MPESLPGSTYWIGRKAVASILHSARSAEAHGRPLNTFATVNLWQLGSTEDTAFADFAKLRGCFARWSARTSSEGLPENGTPTYSYSLENDHDQVHAHWAVHIHPENRDRFEKWLGRCLRRMFGLKKIPEGCVHIEEVYNAEGLKKYLVKNMDPHLGKLWRIRTREGGRIARRRADTSRNIGPAFWRPRKAAYKAGLLRQAPAPAASPQEIAQGVEGREATSTILHPRAPEVASERPATPLADSGWKVPSISLEGDELPSGQLPYRALPNSRCSKPPALGGA